MSSSSTDSQSQKQSSCLPSLVTTTSSSVQKLCHAKRIEYIAKNIEYIDKRDDPRISNIKEFNSNEFQCVRVIGTGSFGTVTCEQLSSTGEYYAIKYLPKEAMRINEDNKGIIDDTFDEVEMLYSFQGSTFLNCCYGFLQTKTEFGIVMKMQSGGELFALMSREEEQLFPPLCKYFVAAEVLAGLEELHHRGVMYRDLKPENILFDADRHIVLSDFGYSKRMSPDERTLTTVGTADYTAPEVIRHEWYGYSADVWSYGVLLYELMCSMPPFNLHLANTTHEKFARILECHLSFPCGLPSSFVNLVSNILQPDVTRRYNIAQIKEHAFFKDIDWDQVSQKKLPKEVLPAITVDISDITKNFDDFDELGHHSSFEAFE